MSRESHSAVLVNAPLLVGRRSLCAVSRGLSSLRSLGCSPPVSSMRGRLGFCSEDIFPNAQHLHLFAFSWDFWLFSLTVKIQWKVFTIPSSSFWVHLTFRDNTPPILFPGLVSLESQCLPVLENLSQCVSSDTRLAFKSDLLNLIAKLNVQTDHLKGICSVIQETQWPNILPGHLCEWALPD